MNTAWESNLYFSVAPLRTADHMNVLLEFVQRIEGLDKGTEIP